MVGEVYFPGSKVPFRPQNPWGRAMPKVKQRSRPPLYQVVVTMMNGKDVPFGPKIERTAADEFCGTIRQSIACGAEKELRAAYVVAVESMEASRKRVTLGDLLKEGGNATVS